MTEYTQVLDEMFNILSMHLPIDRMQRLQFISHFNITFMTGAKNPAPGGPRKGDFNTDDDNWFQLCRPGGQKFALIAIFEFARPKVHLQTEFDLEPLMRQFDKYIAAQETAKRTLAMMQKLTLDAETVSTPNQYFDNLNTHKRVREIDASQFLPQPDYANFRLGPTIPNIGKASL